MAKAKAEKADKSDPDSFVDRVAAEVERDYGKGIMISGVEFVTKPRTVIPVGPALDLISGGIVEGSWVGITGNPKQGKTALALQMAANAQKAEYGSRPIFYFKIEGRMAHTLLHGTRGLDLTKGKFNLFHSIEGKILTSQNFLSIMESTIRTVPQAVLIIDSVSTLCDEKESTDGVGTETRGGGAKLISQFCRTMAQVVPVNRTIVIGITHLISNTSGMGAALVERGSRAWSYQCDYQFRTKAKRPWKVGTRTIGAEVDWVCNSTPLIAPGAAITSYVRYGLGIDSLYELIELGKSAGFVQKSGSWLYLEFLKHHEEFGLADAPEAPKALGADKARELLSEHPDWAAALEMDLKALSGTLVTSGDE